MKTVGIAIKPGAANARDVAEKLTSWLEDKKLEIFYGDGVQEVIKCSPDRVVERKSLTGKCDLVVVLGGDGTLISVCRYPTKNDCVIVGVNLGTLGFLTEIKVEELFDVLERTLAGKATIETQKLLQAEVVTPQGERSEYHAFNDFVLSKQALARIFELNLKVNSEFAAVLRGDGVIVATPAGSTGYNLAAGGSIVHPEVNAILLAPICPHSLSSRPLVVPGGSEIELELDPVNGPDSEVYLTVDGQEGAPFERGAKLIIKTSDNLVRFVRSENRNYFDILRSKLHWRPSYTC